MIYLSENRFEIIDGNIVDFNSRIIKVDSWKDYVNNYAENKTVLYEGVIGNTFGVNFPSNSKVDNLKYNNYELICDVVEYDKVIKRIVQIIDSTNCIEVKKVEQIVDL